MNIWCVVCILKSKSIGHQHLRKAEKLQQESRTSGGLQPPIFFQKIEKRQIGSPSTLGFPGDFLSKKIIQTTNNPVPFGKLTWLAGKLDLLKMYSLLKMGIFHCHVSLPKGSWKKRLPETNGARLNCHLLAIPKKTELVFQPSMFQVTFRILGEGMTCILWWFF